MRIRVSAKRVLYHTYIIDMGDPGALDDLSRCTLQCTVSPRVVRRCLLVALFRPFQCTIYLIVGMS